MQLIDATGVQQAIDALKEQDLYLHLEMTTGAYASHLDSSKITAGTFIRNGEIRYTLGSIAGGGPYRVGLKIGQGWVYAEGLTHWDPGEAARGRLILAGHDKDGKLVVSLQLGREPF
ncbi:YojF family protein [Paenibacillus sp. TAB 01]|uniref:YojF family protein n=1 Tax=Paenibacillus sp. TAB 01 TaxID=3368988 RepID=UPI003752186B